MHTADHDLPRDEFVADVHAALRRGEDVLTSYGILHPTNGGKGVEVLPLPDGPAGPGRAGARGLDRADRRPLDSAR